MLKQIASGIALLTASMSDAQVPQTKPESEVLDLNHDRHQRMTIDISIGGQGPFHFLLDTGAQATVLSRSLADALNLTDRDVATLIGVSSRQKIETAMVPQFRLGRREFVIRSAPLVEAVNIGGGADGILGLDSLQNQRVQIDFRKKFIAIDRAEELGGNRGYEIIVKARRRLGQLIITDALIDGVRTSVIVDTGAQASIGNLALLRRLRKPRDLGATEIIDINGEQATASIRVARKLRLGGIQLQNFPIVFTDALPFDSLDLNTKPALILGMNELRLFRRVAIDFETGRILFDLPRELDEFESFGHSIRSS